MIVLGIETSCDETAAAVVNADRRILANEVFSQIDEHTPFGGVVPEVAARAHLELIDGVIETTIEKAGITLDDLDAVAATGGPGLIGGVLVGTMTAKAIAAVKGCPFIAVNHLEGHALTARLTDDVTFPYLLLLVSGGHCQLLVVKGVGNYKRLGTTIDDALGEAFDKTAKMLGLGFPGGPAVERTATAGDGQRFSLPRPLMGRPGADFSFSGLKTKVRQTIEGLPPGDLQEQEVADLGASFQGERATFSPIASATPWPYSRTFTRTPTSRFWLSPVASPPTKSCATGCNHFPVNKAFISSPRHPIFVPTTGR